MKTLTHEKHWVSLSSHLYPLLPVSGWCHLFLFCCCFFRSLSQELEVLQSIYLDELDVAQDASGLVLRITLHPTTGDDPDTQFVRLTLKLLLTPLYPGEPPEISVTNPRGLCDEQIEGFISILRTTALQSVGCPVLYTLIEKGKEMLTASNLPRGHCVICLYEFQDDDSLTKTRCFHHFHSFCLGRYAKHCRDNSQEEYSVACPVCRVDLTCDVNKLQAAAPPQQAEELYIPDSLTLQREKELRLIYERQLANGGIIDIEAEKNRFFISIQQTSTSEHEVVDTDPVSSHPTVPSTAATPDPCAVKPHVGGLRASGRTHLCGNRPPRNDHPDGQHWRDGRGWTARGRRRPDTRRVCREAASKGDQTAVRSRVTACACQSDGTVPAPPRDGSDSTRGEKPDL
ncbi:E3 ubiquitin-protein ligase RNF25 [Anomaloglossus baeobatrachus]|uniref:E3 ubiquitin-protein ligase RNF25 n=1 Tax=Anomaloglossus baeobatrachus TaxID=238106 RepID=UPI003F4FBE3B